MDIKSKSVLFEDWWTINDCESNPDALFIFGDNDLKKGMKGQAIIRNCKNSHGIPTKKFPSFANSAYYTDAELEMNKQKIMNAMNSLIDRVRDEKYSRIIFPKDGLGTGLSKLDEKAPQTLKFLNDTIFNLFGIRY